MAAKKPLTSRGVLKRSERERSVGLDPEDAAARWLEENDRKPEPPPPKAGAKNKVLHRWRQQQARGKTSSR